MSDGSITKTLAQVSLLFEERMRIKGPVLERQIYKAGHKLPRAVRRSARKIVEMSQLVGHPKLSRRIDHKEFENAARVVVTHLEGIDPRDEAIGRLLKFLGKISAILIIGFVLTVWYLWSKNLI